MQTVSGEQAQKVNVAELANRLSSNLALLIQCEINLAKEEMRAVGRTVVFSTAVIVGGMVLILYGLFFLFFSAVFGIGTVLPTWASSLIIGGGLVVIGLASMAPGIRKLSRIEPLPKTSKTMRENFEWLKRKKG